MTVPARVDRSRWTGFGAQILDIVVALGAAEFGVTFLRATIGDAHPGLAAPAWVLYTLVIAHTVPLVARRRYPRAVLVSSLGTAALTLAAGPPLFFLGPAIFVVLYTVGGACDRRTSLGGLAGAELLWAVSEAVQARPDPGTWLVYAVLLAGAWLLGDNVRRRQQYAAVLEERARQLEQAREELAHRAVSAERLRIARELHDVVAHSLSVIAVQSGVGAHVIDASPADARKALTAIEDTSRAALNEMRRLLGVLRDDDGPGSLRPAPSLGALDDLRRQMADAGLDVELRVEGDVTELPPAVDLSAYRIVQEALTNVVKHAGVDAARVVVRRQEPDLTIEVTDDGGGALGGGSGTGHGILGMRERAAVFGGDFAAGPGPGGRGFRVMARLPFTTPAS